MPAAIQTARTPIWRARTLSAASPWHLMISNSSDCISIYPRFITGCIRSFWMNCIPHWQQRLRLRLIGSRRRISTKPYKNGTATSKASRQLYDIWSGTAGKKVLPYGWHGNTEPAMLPNRFRFPWAVLTQSCCLGQRCSGALHSSSRMTNSILRRNTTISTILTQLPFGKPSPNAAL